MIWLFENPYAILIVGILALAVCIAAFVQTGRLAFLLATFGAVLLTSVLLLVEWVVLTDREQVEQTLDGLATALESNDLAAVLGFLAPDAAEMRQAAETRLPAVEVEEAKVGGLEVTINELTSPPTATARFLGRIQVRDAGGVLGEGTYARRFIVRMRKENGRWLLFDYEEGPVVGKGA